MSGFGSGYFGDWITDASGLPAYSYTCNQNTDPKAATPTNTVWRGEREHTFQFGNDRIIAVCGNNGAVRVRQDEGVPKLLGDYDPEEFSFGGGIGWLTDGTDTLCTHYDCPNDSFNRVYGMGYMRKTVSKGKLNAEQLIFAPYGDDPVLVSRVTVKNTSDKAQNLRWFEYWSARHYPLSYRTLLYSLNGSSENLESFINNSARDMRKRLANKFKHRYAQEGGILSEQKIFGGWSIKDKLVWRFVQKKFRPLAETAKNASLYVGELNDQEDLNPPSTFLFAADAPLDGFVTDGKRFFGAGGLNKPDGLSAPQFRKAGKKDAAMTAVSSFTLNAGESRTLTFVYGYVPEGFSQPELVKKYSGGFDELFEASCKAWNENRVSLKLPGEDWVDRELLWHHHALRSAQTYDSSFGEHILSQGHLYQYIMAFQGAARDPLQHVMPFIFTDPGLVKEVIRYTLKEMLPDGEIPYGIAGKGQIMLSPIISSDFELWLIWTASEYILAHKDISFLSELVEPYPYKGIRQEKQTVLNLLIRACEHFIDHTGHGDHGLPHLLGGDWNDNIVMGSISVEQHERIRAEGESVLVGAMAAVVLNRFADVLVLAGRDGGKQRDYAEKMRAAVETCWNGKWLRRAYLSSELGWVGDDLLWLEPQPWALLADAVTDREELLRNINELVRKPSPIGALLTNDCPMQMNVPRGTVTNGGIWPSINGTLILALSRADMPAAWEEWRKNTLAYHAENYPESWEGIWSGPDCYNSYLAETPGRAYFEPDPEKRAQILNWTDWPVYNLHPHAWTIYNAACLFANEFTRTGAVFTLAFPAEEYEFSSPLASLKRTSQGFEGHYCPSVTGNWDIELHFFKPDGEFELTVNGETAQYLPTASGIRFTGEGGGASPLIWEIKLKGK